MSNNASSAGEGFLDVLRLLHQDRASIKLSWQYKGMILTQEVWIQEVGPDWAVFQLSADLLFTLPEKTLFLQTPEFPKTVVARRVDLHPGRGLLTLAGFASRPVAWKDRRQERVQPKDPVYVSLAFRERRLRVCLEDASTSGMGVLGYKLFDQRHRLAPGEEVAVDFVSPLNAARLALKGGAVYLKTISPELVKLGIEFTPGSQNLPHLTQYVDRRKEEILAELTQSHGHQDERYRVSQLYF